MRRPLDRFLFLFLFLYTLATILHFVHNGVFLDEYPNMPGWIGRAEVALGLGGVLAIGALGCLMYVLGWARLGLLVLMAYAALGFDGLAHYGLAPLSAHSISMNATILLEVAAAALLLVVVLLRLVPDVVRVAR